jgi:hypothetical protein
MAFNHAKACRIVSALLIIAVSSGAPAAAQGSSESLAGLYDGSQTEIGAALELRSDGRYRYQLSYGALDEWSVGTWESQPEGITLSSDPFKAPTFEFAQDARPTGILSVKLDLPDGFDPQYFAINLHRKDGTVSIEDMQGGSLEIPMGDNPVVTLKPVLPVMDIVGPEIMVPGGGAILTIAFQPNDLGFVGFAGENLRANGGGFEMNRFERTLHFRRVH